MNMQNHIANILIIEDDPAIIQFLQVSLENETFKLLTAQTAAKGYALAESKQLNLILLDLGLPDQDGLQVLRKLREWASIPIIVISARGEERDIVLSLDLGADDYLTKPFGIPELLARIRVALRHWQQKKLSETPIFEVDDLRVDLSLHQVWLANQEIKLTPIQYELLAVLVRNAGKVVTRKQLLSEVWGPHHESEMDYLRIYIHQLRNKLEKNPAHPKYLRTETGVGYRLYCKD